MTVDVETLRALAERCEAATGGDRALDAAISAAVRLDAVPDWARMWAGEWRGHEDGTVHMIHSDGSLGPHLKAREWTASLDAARTLVPDAHTIQLSDWDADVLREKGAWQAIVLPLGARGAMSQFTFSNRCDHAVTPALALTAASLRARAEMVANDG